MNIHAVLFVALLAVQGDHALQGGEAEATRLQ